MAYDWKEFLGKRLRLKTSLYDELLDMGVHLAPLTELGLVGLATSQGITRPLWKVFVKNLCTQSAEPCSYSRLVANPKVTTSFYTREERTFDIGPGDLFFACSLSRVWFDVLGEAPVKVPARVISDYPHKCPSCGGPAYLGFQRVVCRIAGCDGVSRVKQPGKG